MVHNDLWWPADCINEAKHNGHIHKCGTYIVGSILVFVSNNDMIYVSSKIYLTLII